MLKTNADRVVEFLLQCNAGPPRGRARWSVDHEGVPFVLPSYEDKTRWEVLLDTREATGKRRCRTLPGKGTYELVGRSLAVLRRKM